jgi:hypothetical protein
VRWSHHVSRFTLQFIIGLGILSSFILLLADFQRRDESSGFLSRMAGREKRPLANELFPQDGSIQSNTPQRGEEDSDAENSSESG